MRTGPLDELSEEDQKMAVDIACAASLLVTRLPNLSNEFGEALVSEFAAQYGVPRNLARYAMRAIGASLFRTSWEFSIKKDPGGAVTTRFEPGLPVTVNLDPKLNGQTGQ